MHESINTYSLLLTRKKILYVPICLMLERLTRLYGLASQLAPMKALPEETMGFLFRRLQCYVDDIRLTAESYGNGRVKLFMGDWKQKADAANVLCRGLQANLRKISGRNAKFHRRDILEALEALQREWNRLCRVLSDKGHTIIFRNPDAGTNYFHSNNLANWQQTMAAIILSIDEEAQQESPDTHLILLCHSRIKAHLVRQIEKIQQKSNAKEKFDKDRILCVDDCDGSTTCPTCMRFSDKTRNSASIRNSRLLEQLRA